MVAADDAGDDGGFVLNLINPAPAGGNARRPSLAVSGRKRKGQWKAKHLAKKAARASAWAPAAPDGGAGAAAQRPVASPAATAAATKQPDAANPGKRPVTKPSNHEQLRRRRRQDAAAGAADAGDADAGSAPPPAAAWQFAPAAAVNHGRPQVVSSLFSAIPELPAAPSASRDAEPAVRVAPSNAASSAAAHTFEALGVDADIAAHVTARLNVRRPTSIQRKVIPVLLNPGDDATNPVVRAQTGSGKTLSYLLPIVQRLLASGGDEAAPASRSLGTLAIVLTPTRELARQQAEVLDTILSLPPCTHTGKRRSHWIVAGTVSGGDKKKSEKARLRKGVTILVSTPGRLLDHLQNTESFAVEKLRWLVLDEADRLMDLGFEETIRKIVQILDSRARMHSQAAKAGAADSFGEVGCSPKRRQTILCSATLNDAVMRLADEDLTNTRVLEAELDVTPAEGKSAEEGVTEQSGANIAALSTTYNTPKQLRQSYVVTPAKLRLVALAAILKTM
ncbi:MAG: P-loop containing nucleoside triphosphate hydrolase protein, partial [Olpidium bornovanus]